MVMEMFIVQRNGAQQILKAEGVEVLFMGLVFCKIDSEISLLPDLGNRDAGKRILWWKIPWNSITGKIKDLIFSAFGGCELIPYRPCNVGNFPVV